MSKIGRKAIALGNVAVVLKGSEVQYKGSKGSGAYAVPSELLVQVEDGQLFLKLDESKKLPRDVNRIWGLHRALLANKIKGADVGFEKKLQIIGLGYKAVKSGDKIVFSLGFSHKIDFDLPGGVTLDIDRTGQNLTFSSHDKELVGLVCSEVRALRAPEPYKGTGIRLVTEVVVQKAGKTKSK
ncbi:MAG TPA: 50S ribosomal protein L6 [Candidatus Babeliales bacterium]|nr:50S ribosomal protein L6 [Candidatus Babeliales bacterium]